MKRFLMIALLIGAIPAVAVGQTVMCDECTHVASVYMGEGGFIATADDADMVTWVASCGGVTRSGEEPADDDGVVSALWTGDLACMADGGTFEIGPVMDGGWFLGHGRHELRRRRPDQQGCPRQRDGRHHERRATVCR